LTGMNGAFILFVWFFLKLMNFFAHFDYFWCFCFNKLLSELITIN
jgi:hypothetical protein